MRFLGIDGCKNGWIITEIDEKKDYNIFFIKEIEELVDVIKNYCLTLIDIPIGLSNSNYRECDILARKILGKRASTIFLLPSRESLMQSDYRKACAVNYRIMGKKISKQVWNIRNKIIKVNKLVKLYNLHGKIRESHPEICFWSLNDKIPCKHSKHTEEGIKERFQIISKFVCIEKLIYFIRNKKYKDDIIDSFVLALTATNFNNLKKLPEYDDYDIEGIIREIVYSDL